MPRKVAVAAVLLYIPPRGAWLLQLIGDEAPPTKCISSEVARVILTVGD